MLMNSFFKWLGSILGLESRMIAQAELTFRNLNKLWKTKVLEVMWDDGTVELFVYERGYGWAHYTDLTKVGADLAEELNRIQAYINIHGGPYVAGAGPYVIPK